MTYFDDLPPIQNLQTTDNNMRLLMNQLTNLRNAIMSNTAITDSLIGTIQDEGMTSSILILDEDGDSLEFICEDDGTLIEDT